MSEVMNNFVVSPKRGQKCPEGQALSDLFSTVQGVRIIELLPTGRRLTIEAKDADSVLQAEELANRNNMHFGPRVLGHLRAI
jgi:hypothetical protein